MTEQLKVALARPQTITGKIQFVSQQIPLNLASLGAYLLRENIEVEIWDFDVEGYSFESLKNKIERFKPNILGISCFTPTILRGEEIAKHTKEIAPEILTVVGGSHTSALPVRALEECPEFDIAVMGEGEETLHEICLNLKKKSFSKVKGIAYREKDKITLNDRRPPIKDLDNLPMPARHLLQLDKYVGQSYRGFSRDVLKITEISTSRGCPCACIFCAIQVTMGLSVRFRSYENVIKEIDHCINEYGINHFVFLDDTFTMKHSRFNIIIEHLGKRKVTWNCTTRVNTVNQKLLHKMKKCGCEGIAFGIESGSQRILDLIGKKIKIKQVEDAFRMAHNAGIKNIEADFILGSHFSETPNDLKRTARLIRKIKPTNLFVSTIVPYPGTPLYYDMIKEGLLPEDHVWENFLMYGGKPNWRTSHFTIEELQKKQKKILKEFYLSFDQIINKLSSISSTKELMYYFKAGIELIKETIFRK